ncbi:MAG: hypothetical protein WCK60_02565 [Candidatus Nomurabacteria bacterium]
MKNKIINKAYLFIFLAVFSQCGLAESNTLVASCATKGTAPDGSRKHCDSTPPTCFEAPSGFVLAKDTLNIQESGNGNHSCSITWENPVDVIPGVPQPTKICITGSADSPGGMRNMNAQGDVKCIAAINYVRLSGK